MQVTQRNFVFFFGPIGIDLAHMYFHW